jgi:ABC-type antimicrobial peptide transport system ATPase subunit
MQEFKKQKKEISDAQLIEIKSLVESLPEDEQRQFAIITKSTTLKDLKKLAEVAEVDLCGVFVEGGQRNNLTTTKQSVAQEIIESLKDYKEYNSDKKSPTL